MPSPPESSGRGFLPVELTTFIGRERELAELRRLLANARLLTLTGGGGSGKTRLAAELVGSAAADLGLDAAWIELAPLDDGAHLAQHVATALGITDEIRSGDFGLLARLLGTRRLLLVVDNCEHLVDGCAALVDVLLKACPDIRVLATSREALGIKGERAWLVPALPLADALELFVERARDFAGGFELTDRNRASVEEICTRLDGIPLAIELAAARIRVLSPEQLRDRLNDAFRLLKSPARTPIPRHRTLAAAIDWSYDLLTEPERLLFQRVSVFQGGFTLDALEYVAGAAPGDDVLDVLARLVDRSLVQVREQGNGARYSLLETVRQYARQKLEDCGDAPATRRQHARYVYQLAIEAEPHFIKPERPRWVERLLPDLENIREALNFTREGDAPLHVKLTGSLWWFWYSTRHWTEAAGILARALALPEAAAPTRERAKLLFALGALNSLQARQLEARAYLEEAIRIAQQCDEQLLAYCQNYLAMTYAAESSKEGVALSTQAAAWFEKHDDPYGQRMSYLMLGTMAGNTGDLAEGERWSRMGLEIARDFGQPRELSIAYHMLAWIRAERGDLAGATRYVLESLRASRQDPSFFSISNALDLLGEITGQQGDPLRAARIFGAAEGVRAVIGSRRFPYVEKRQAVKIAAFRAAAGDAAFDQAWAEGRMLPADTILADVLAGQPASTAEPAPAPAPAADGSTAKLIVRAMGRFEVAVEGQTVPDELWAYGKPKELLVYLALHPVGRPRDQIARDLWPSATPSQLKNSFHVTLHHLRKALGHPEWIVLEEQRYRLARGLDYETDFGRFERCAHEALRDQRVAGLQEALELYRGDLLEGEVAGEWVEEHLSHLRRIYLELALTLGATLEQNGQFEKAIRLYQQLIARDDLQEEPHRRLIAHWARTGERPRALKHYERLAATLRATLDAEPERETLNLYRSILTNDAV